MAMRAIDTADKMGKMAQAAGTSVENFSALSYAAKLSDVDTGSLSTGMVNLAKNLSKANQATQEGRAAHSALGTLFRGNVPVFKDTNDAFVEISKRLGELPIGLERTNLSAQIFGKGVGAALIPMQEGLAGAVEEAKKLGVVITGQVAKGAERFQDNITRLRAVLDGLVIKTLPALIPQLEAASNSMLSFANNAGNMKSATEHLINLAGAALVIFQSLRGAIEVIAADVEWLGKSLARTAKFIADIAKTPFNNSRASSVLRDYNAEMDQIRWDRQQTFVEALARIQSAAEGTKLAVDALNLGEAFGPALPAGLNSTVQAAAAVTGEGKKAIAALQLQIDLYGLSVRQAAILKAEREGHTKAEAAIEGHLANQLDLMNKAASAMPRGRGGFTGIMPDVQAPEFAFVAPEIDIKALGLELDKLPPKFQALRPIAIQVREDMAQMFTRAITRAEGFRDALGNILQTMSEMILQLGAMQPLMNALFGNQQSGSGIGGILGKIGGAIAGAFAGPAAAASGVGSISMSGGPLWPGFADGGHITGPSWVGERGKELFVPDSAGTIVSNNKLGGSITVAPVYNINAAPGTDMAGLSRVLKQSEDRTVARTLAIIGQNGRRRA